MPIYGDGQQIRDWLYVDDHCAALRASSREGGAGEVYNISARAEKTNLAGGAGDLALSSTANVQGNRGAIANLSRMSRIGPGMIGDMR